VAEIEKGTDLVLLTTYVTAPLVWGIIVAPGRKIGLSLPGMTVEVTAVAFLSKRHEGFVPKQNIYRVSCGTPLPFDTT
jgi:hypothetical protein